MCVICRHPLFKKTYPKLDLPLDSRILKGGGVQGEGVFLGNPRDSVWEDWGTLGNIRND